MLDAVSRLDQISARLRAGGFRVTPQRVAILRALLVLGHPNAGQIHQRVRVHFPMTSLATVYSTLALLQEIGEIQELDLGGAASHYDGLNPSPHPHLICSHCGMVVDAQVGLLGDVLKDISASGERWTVTERLDCWGVCPRCLSDSSQT